MSLLDSSKLDASAPSFMRATLSEIRCPGCGNVFKSVAQKSFLGFKNFNCEICGENFKYPLHSGHRITYWILLLLFFGMYYLEIFGHAGIFVVLMMIAVAVDVYLLIKRW